MARHRVALASAAAVLVTIAVAAPIVTRERMRAADERQRARQVEEVLGHLFSLPNARRMSRAPSAEVLVEHAARLVRRDLQSQAASQARLLTMLGGVYSSMGRYEAAIDVFQEAHALRAHEFGPDSAEAAESLVAQAQSQHFSGRYEEAERNLRRAAAMLHDRLGPTHRQTLSAALEMGDLLHTRGDLVHAERTLQAAIERLRSFAAPPEMMSRAVRDLGNVQRDRGDLVRSDALFRESLRVLDRADFDASAQTAITEVYFSRLLVKRRAFSEADDLLARALPALRLSYEGDHPMMAFALQNLGYLRMEEGRFGEADGHLADARRVAIAWLGADHPLVARITADQAELARRQGRIPDAIEIARHALAQFERFGLARHPAAIDAHWTLGDALIAARLPSEAGRILRAGVAAAERQYVAGDARIARARQLLARASLPRQ